MLNQRVAAILTLGVGQHWPSSIVSSPTTSTTPASVLLRKLAEKLKSPVPKKI